MLIIYAALPPPGPPNTHTSIASTPIKPYVPYTPATNSLPGTSTTNSTPVVANTLQPTHVQSKPTFMTLLPYIAIGGGLLTLLGLAATHHGSSTVIHAVDPPVHIQSNSKKIYAAHPPTARVDSTGILDSARVDPDAPVDLSAQVHSSLPAQESPGMRTVLPSAPGSSAVDRSTLPIIHTVAVPSNPSAPPRVLSDATQTSAVPLNPSSAPGSTARVLPSAPKVTVEVLSARHNVDTRPLTTSAASDASAQVPSDAATAGIDPTAQPSSIFEGFLPVSDANLRPNQFDEDVKKVQALLNQAALPRGPRTPTVYGNRDGHAGILPQPPNALDNQFGQPIPGRLPEIQTHPGRQRRSITIDSGDGFTAVPPNGAALPVAVPAAGQLVVLPSSTPIDAKLPAALPAAALSKSNPQGVLPGTIVVPLEQSSLTTRQSKKDRLLEKLKTLWPGTNEADQGVKSTVNKGPSAIGRLTKWIKGIPSDKTTNLPVDTIVPTNTGRIPQAESSTAQKPLLGEDVKGKGLLSWIKRRKKAIEAPQTDQLPEKPSDALSTTTVGVNSAANTHAGQPGTSLSTTLSPAVGVNSAVPPVGTVEASRAVPLADPNFTRPLRLAQRAANTHADQLTAQKPVAGTSNARDLNPVADPNITLPPLGQTAASTRRTTVSQNPSLSEIEEGPVRSSSGSSSEGVSSSDSLPGSPVGPDDRSSITFAQSKDGSVDLDPIPGSLGSPRGSTDLNNPVDPAKIDPAGLQTSEYRVVGDSGAFSTDSLSGALGDSGALPSKELGALGHLLT